MRYILLILFLISSVFALDKRQDIIIDSNSDKIMGEFVFDKVNTYMRNNYGTNLLEGKYKYDIEIIEKVVDRLDKDDRQFIEDLAGEFDKEINYKQRSLIKNIKDLRMKITIKDIEYKLDSLSPDFTFKSASEKGFTFKGNFKTNNFRLTFNEIHFALEVPVDCITNEITGKKRCSEDGEQMYWGPEFILNKPAIYTTRVEGEPPLEFESIFKISPVNDHELAPVVQEIDFSPLVKFMQDYRNRVHFSFNPEDLVVSTFSLQIGSVKLDLLHEQGSKNNIVKFISKNEEEIREILIHQIEKKLSGDIDEDDEHAIVKADMDSLVESDDFPSIIKKNIEQMRFDRDHLMSSDGLASLIRIEELIGNPYSERIQLVLPNFLCIADQNISELGKLNEQRIQLAEDLNQETKGDDNEVAVEGIKNATDKVVKRYRHAADLCKQEDIKRYSKVNKDISEKEKNESWGFDLLQKEEGMKLSVTPKMLNNIFKATYDAGLWGGIFNDESGATLGDKGMSIFFNETEQLTNNTSSSSGDLYMDLIYYDIDGLTKFMLGLSGKQEGQSVLEPKYVKPKNRSHVKLANKGKVIRFPIHMKVSARFEIREQNLKPKGEAVMPDDEEKYEKKCFDSSGKQIKGAVPYFVFKIDDVPSIAKNRNGDFINKEGLLKGIKLKVDEGKTLEMPSNIHKLNFKKKILKEVDSFFSDYIGQDVLPIRYCSLRGLKLEQLKFKLLGDGRLTVVFPTVD